MLVMVHSSGTGGDTAKTIHIFESSKCLNHVKRIKDYFANLTSTEYFTDTWSSNNNRDMTVVLVITSGLVSVTNTVTV